MSQQSSRGAAWDKLRLKCLDRDGWVCAYCGKHLEGKDATADHIIAKENGGKDELTNLVSACRKCNGEKSDRIMVRMNWFNKKWLNNL
jgi:5-methylcytosine-specific restriction endonuclease McrA